MKAFTIKWRSARQFREWELLADEEIGACLLAALEESGGSERWRLGTLWKCPGCGDRTLRTEAFREGLALTVQHLQTVQAESPARPSHPEHRIRARAINWAVYVTAKMQDCERDRVYIKDEDGVCSFANQTYLSRI